MSIYEYDDYKKWVKDVLTKQPKGGRGQLKRIADHLSISPTIVTQVFSGDRDITAEQALLMGEYFNLSKIETRYLLLLVNFSRAGSHRYRESLREEILEMREKSRELSNRVNQNFALSEEAKAILYSNWYYLAVWSLTAIDGFHSIEKISERLNLNKKKTREAIDFLVKYSLIIENDEGQFRVGPTLVHLESGSPQIPRHHQNWRLQAFPHYENGKAENVHYTAPVTLSEADARKLRENILKFISESVNVIKESPSEKLYCLCIDWFEV